MNNVQEATATEMMTIASARLLRNGQVCFVGIGLPSAAANLARLTHAPEVVLIYESGPIGAKPDVLPLSIGDSELALTADCVVSTPEIFRYWLQGGRVGVGFLGGAQIDKFANLNTTVVGKYARPKVRLPGAGGAPEIASSAREVFIIMRHSKRTFVEKLDFLTSIGFGEGGGHRERLGLPGRGPQTVVTDLCVFNPDKETRELTVTGMHEGVTRDQVQEATGWKVRFATNVEVIETATKAELLVLRDLQARFEAHFQILRYDMRGHGRSSVPFGPYAENDLGADVLHLLDSVGITTTHFCGLSVGGVIGQWLAANAPSRFDKFVFSNTAAKIGTYDSWSERIATVTRDGMAAIADALLQRWFTPSFLKTEAPTIAELRASLLKIDPAGYVSTCAALRDTDQRGLIHSIQNPVLIIAGTNDQVTTIRDAEFLATHIPGGIMVELQAAHISSVECAAEFSADVISFLRR